MNEPGGKIDRMRKALVECTFLPGSSHKRFARQLSQMYLDKITPKQERHLIRLAWRYRRQMPAGLVPSKDAVQALDSVWQEQTVAGMTVMVPGGRSTPKPKVVAAPASLPLFESIDT